MRRGFTLVECELAAAFLGLSAFFLLKGVPLATRIATENAQLLAADSLAWDAAWKTFNVPYASLPEKFNEEALTVGRTGFGPSDDHDIDVSKVKVCELPAAAAPELYVAGSPAVLLVAVVPTPDTNDVVLVSKMGIHLDRFCYGTTPYKKWYEYYLGDRKSVV